MSILRRLTERRDYGGGNFLDPYASGQLVPPPWYDSSSYSAAGVRVDEKTALSLVDVYAATGLVADSLAMLPVGTFRKVSDAERQSVSPTPSLVVQPDPEWEAIQFYGAATMSLLLRGNVYAELYDFDAMGYPRSAKLIHPDDVTPKRNKETGALEYHLRNKNVLTRANMLHIPWMLLPGAVRGLSPIECAARSIGTAIATESFGARWFSEGASPSSALETDAELDDDQARKVMANWMTSHGGRRRPALLSGGLKWRPITITPNESQFLESKLYSTAQIARLFRVPPHMIGHLEKSTSWGTGIEEQGIGYVVYTLGPVLARFEAALTRRLPRPQYVKWNVAALLRGATQTRYASYALGRQWGWLSVNDIRTLEDLPPIEGGDVYLQPLNMIEAKEALDALLNKPAGGTSGA